MSTKRRPLISAVLLMLILAVNASAMASVLEVGAGKTYTSISSALSASKPGDSWAVGPS
jgi:hypothetical protein